MEDRLASGFRASEVGLGINGGLAVVKLVVGIVGDSYTLVADAIESSVGVFALG